MMCLFLIINTAITNANCIIVYESSIMTTTNIPTGTSPAGVSNFRRQYLTHLGFQDIRLLNSQPNQKESLLEPLLEENEIGISMFSLINEF